jgi:hypothetical protein
MGAAAPSIHEMRPPRPVCKVGSAMLTAMTSMHEGEG